MRFDVNISTAPKGSGELGTRTEIKNLNSFRSVERASEYEFRRQVELLERGEKIVQETRGWDENKQKTTVQRSKEDSQDYRYMPDADIPPVVLSDEEIRKIQGTVPALPPFYRDAWKNIGFDPTVINALLASRTLAELVQRIYENKGENAAKRVGLWYVILVNNLSEDESVGRNEVPIKDEYLIELSDMVEAGELSSTAAKKIFLEINRSPKNPRAIASEMNLLQVSDESEIIAIVEEVLADKSSERAISDLRKGNEKVIGFLVGQVMRKSGGKANPALVQKIIKQKIKSE
jgi:aspartyl-tRNA(Asn)/glutamyl-tRNA(Gln) amidotransferase subunit B